jgi:hypothetical protein
VRARPVAIRARGPSHGLDEAAERVLDVATEQVDVGDEDLRVHVVR